MLSWCRGVAQPGSAHAWGACGHRFKSGRPDHFQSCGLRQKKLIISQRRPTRLIPLPAISPRLNVLRSLSVEVRSRHILLASFSDGDVGDTWRQPESADQSSGAQKKRRRKEPPPAALETERSAISSFEEAQERLATVPVTIAGDCAEFNWPVRCISCSIRRAVPVNFLDFQKPDALED